MRQDLILEKFEKMGAKAQIRNIDSSRGGWPFTFDVINTAEGEVFDIGVVKGEKGTLQVMDVQKELRHLLLMMKNEEGDVAKVLCGHDEREWFTCGVPGGPSNVRQAMVQLRPEAVKKMTDKKNTTKRKAKGKYIRQGEWFFIPAPDAENPPDYMLLKKEPITRGDGGKPHIAQFAFRSGRGRLVHVHAVHAPQGVSLKEKKRIMKENGVSTDFGWWTMQNMDGVGLFVKGTIRHPDHKTLKLPFWHRVELNEERRSTAVRAVQFLD